MNDGTLSLFFVVFCSFGVGFSLSHIVWSPETADVITWMGLILAFLAVVAHLPFVYKAIKKADNP